MKNLNQIALALLSTFALAVPNQTRAQFTGNNQTNIISGVTTNWGGPYYVGSNYVFDALLIQNAGVLSNTSGFIGYAAGANNNIAIVSGSGATYTVSVSGMTTPGLVIVSIPAGAATDSLGNTTAASIPTCKQHGPPWERLASSRRPCTHTTTPSTAGMST